MNDPDPTSSARALFVAAAFVFMALVPASVELRTLPEAAIHLPSSVSRTATLVVAALRADTRSPLARATVRVFFRDGNRYVLAGIGATGDEGRLTLRDLPTGAHWLLMESDGFARASTSFVLGGGATAKTVALRAAHALAVRVTDETGAAVHDATVLVTGVDPLPFGALTNAEGRAAFHKLDDPPFRLRIYARGYDPESRSSVTGDETIVLHAASALDVLATGADGNAVPRATVLVAGGNLWPARSVETGADGHARITSLETGAYDLKATAGTLVSRIETGVRVERGQTRAVSLVLEPGRMIPIVVTEGEGDHPLVVPNADVVLVENGISSFPMEGRTNTFGKVTLGPAAVGPMVAAAHASGFVARAAVPVPDSLDDDFTIALVRGATLRGDVVDRKGRPVDGASIEIVGTDLDGMPIAETPIDEQFRRAHFDAAFGSATPLLPRGELGVMEGPIPGIPEDSFTPNPLAEKMVLAPDAIAPWVTNLDGTFRASPVPPGRVRALVRHPSFVEGTSDAVTLGPGGEVSVHVVLDEGGSIEGTVVDDSGLPVAGARVEVAAIAGTLNRTATAASDGTFAFAAVPKDVFLSLARPDEPYKPVVRKRLSVEEGKTTEVEITLPAPRAELEVTVSDASGAPVKLAQITALSLDPDELLRTTAFSGDDGRAVIRDAVGLPLRVIVEAPSFARWTTELDKAPEKLAVDLASGVIIEGHVTAVRGRRDVEGATVEVLAEGSRRVAFTDAVGRYRMPDLAPGKIHLVVSHPDYATVETDVVVAATGRSDRPFDVDPIDLVEPGSVAGHVVDRAGKPIGGARVAIGTVAAYVPVGVSAEGTVVTSADGAFRLPRVRPGVVTVEAYAPDVGRGRAENVTVDSDRTADGVVVRLEGADEAESSATGGVAVTLSEHDAGGGKEIVVREVASGSEAEHAGVVAGDVIASIDRTAPKSVEEARRMLSGPDGSDVVIQLRRQGAALSFRVARERVRR